MVDGFTIGTFGRVDYRGGGHFFDACVENRVDFVASELLLRTGAGVSRIQLSNGEETDLSVTTDGFSVGVEDTVGSASQQSPYQES